jgi:hypothetical protein
MNGFALNPMTPSMFRSAWSLRLSSSKDVPALLWIWTAEA